MYAMPVRVPSLSLPGMIALLMLLAIALPAWAGQIYFVSPAGQDTHPGLSRNQPLATLAKGISLLQPGDTLIILPGTYHESINTTLQGTPDQPITIRAERPGTARLRGDRDIDQFEKLPGSRYTYTTPLREAVEGVAERSTLRQYNHVPSAHELDEVPASFFYDPDQQRLYVRTSDGRPPAARALSVSVTNGFGLLLGDSHDVIIEGLVVSGYQNRDRAPLPGAGTRWGIYLIDSQRITVRHCTVFFNGGGIGMARPTDTVIEHCIAFANDSIHHASGGNIISRGRAVNVTYRHNLSHTTQGRGIRFYTGGSENGLMLNNLVYDTAHEALQFKGGDHATGRIVGNVALGMVQPGNVPSEHIQHNVIANTPATLDASNIHLARRFDPAAHFADPIHHDYRLQSDSSLRGSGPAGVDPGPFPYRDEVFYVSPAGDDRAAGTSLKQAWRTLSHAARAAEPGQTIYILQGVYHETLQPQRSGTAKQPIVFRRYGRDQVVLDGQGQLPTGVNLDDREYITVEGLAIQNFTQTALSARRSVGVIASYNQIADIAAHGVDATAATDIRLTHNLLRRIGQAAIALTGANRAEVAGNLFEPIDSPALRLDPPALQTLWSDENLFTLSSYPLAQLGTAAFDTLPSWQQASRLDAHSLTAEPGHPSEPTHGAAALLPGRGPLASAIGPWQRQRVERTPRIEDIRIHSVTATTVNLEWWTPADHAVTMLRWGKTEAMENRVEDIHAGSSFHTVSLIGLEPDTTYYFQVQAVSPVWEIHSDPQLAQAEQEKTRQLAEAQPQQFRTRASDPEPRHLYVSLEGDDDADGQTPATAWRTLQHASNQARPGDTVHVAPGRYETFMAVRTTGDEGRPITFRGSDRGQVWLEGSGKVRPTAIRSAFKHHIRLENFYLRDFAQSPYGSTGSTGAIDIVGGSHHFLHRCFFDGRSTGGYVGLFVRGSSSDHLTVDNCVIVQGWNGANFNRCPNLVIQHSVLYNTQIRHLFVFNEPDQPVTLTHNLICDNIPTKINNALLSLWHWESLRSDHNFYFTRSGPDQRLLVSAIRVGDEIRHIDYTLQKLQAQGLDTHSRYGNPHIGVVDRMELEPAQWAQTEVHRDGTALQPLDFDDFLSASPAALQAADQRPIGLDPSLFQAP